MSLALVLGFGLPITINARLCEAGSAPGDSRMRTAKGVWNPKAKRYYARLGPPKTPGGRPSNLPLLYEDGRPVRKNDEAGRLDALARMIAARAKVVVEVDEGPTVRVLSALYYAWQVDRGAAKRTVADHRKHLGRFCKFVGADGRKIGDRLASSITPRDVWAFQDANTAAMRLVIHSILACWRWAARPVRGREPMQLLPANPLQGVERPPAGSRTNCEIDWRTARRIIRIAHGAARKPDKDHRVMNGVRRRMRCVCLHLIAATGARPSEAAILRWDEIDWETGIIEIGAERDKRRRPGRKPRKARRFVVPTGLLSALRVIRDWPLANPTWCFAVKGRGKEPTIHGWDDWMASWLKPLVARRVEGVPAEWSAYWLRHAAINVALREGEPADVVGDQYGNSAAAMRSYAQAADKVRVRVAESVKRGRRRDSRKVA